MRRRTKATRVLSQLDAIEAEMKRIGYWSNDPPNLLKQVQTGEIKTFLDAPSFELWLQCIFLPNARSAARDDHLPHRSQVGLMAQRQYDYHSHIPEAQILSGLLHDFDRIIERQ